MRGEARQKPVVVLLPSLNEEEGLRTVMPRIPRRALEEQGHDVVVWVIDGKSRDGTREVAFRQGAAVLVQQGNGKGQGMRQAFEYFLNGGRVDPEREALFVMLDADGTYAPEAIVDVVTALKDGHEVVMGSRFLGTLEPGALTKLNRVGNRILTALARLLYAAPISDLCTGMWGFTESFLRRMVLTANGFDLEADIFTSACELSAQLAEVPVGYGQRIGEPKLVPVRSGLLIALRLIVNWLNRGERGSGSSVPHPFVIETPEAT